MEDRNNQIYLIKQTFVQNKYGVQQPEEEKRLVFCSVDSITHAEKIGNGLEGLNKSFKFTISAIEYEDEEIVEYKGKRYVVYDARDIRNNMLLYVRSEKGA